MQGIVQTKASREIRDRLLPSAHLELRIEPYQLPCRFTICDRDNSTAYIQQQRLQPYLKCRAGLGKEEGIARFYNIDTQKMGRDLRQMLKLTHEEFNFDTEHQLILSFRNAGARFQINYYNFALHVHTIIQVPTGCIKITPQPY